MHHEEEMITFLNICIKIEIIEIKIIKYVDSY